MSPTHPHPDPVCNAVLQAYAAGIFPMADPDTGDIGWYDPPTRGIIPLVDAALRTPRSLRQRVRSARFAVTTNTAFEHVIAACAQPRPGQDDTATWIDPQIRRLYTHLHAHGHAHSIEAWRSDDAGHPQLVGGLYGVAHRGLFAGESMFSRPNLGGTDASKVCLVHLWHHLRARGYALLDCQFWTPHLATLGCIEITRDEYHAQLARAMDITPRPWGTLAEPP